MFDLRNTLIAVAVASVLAGIAGWTANGWRLNAKIDKMVAVHAEQLAAANADALAKYTAMERKKQEALDEANKIAQRNARAADAARSELDRLRSQLSSGGVSTATCTSVRNYAATLQGILGECAATVEWLAKEADGHALDSRTLNGAWPR
jgi:hypothetical protein